MYRAIRRVLAGQIWRRLSMGVLAWGLLALAGCGSSSSTPTSSPGATGGALTLFRADDGVHGDEPWVTDGTIAGTRMVKDINAAGASQPNGFIAFAGSIYFRADSDGDGYSELWRTDGTEVGTTQVLAAGGQVLTLVTQLTVVGNLLYFQSDSDFTPGFPYDTQLWRTDGTQAGTVDVSTGSAFSDGTTFDVQNLTAAGGTLYMAGIAGGAGAWHLMTSDGTTINEVLTDPGMGPVPVVNPLELAFVNGTLYFAADDGSTSNYELWTTDGTTAGTKLLQDIVPGAGSSWPQRITGLGSTILMVLEENTYGRELWTTDGSPTGATLVKDIWVGGWGDPSFLTVANNLLFFRAADGTNTDLWKSDGTNAGTVALPVPSPAVGGAYPFEVMGEGARVFFVGSDSTGTRMFVTNGGTPAALGPASSGCATLLGTAQGYVAVALDPIGGSGFEVWLSDGTPTNTVKVPGATPYIPCG